MANNTIFMIGTGRNGSTLISDILATHPDLTWVSNYQDKFPKYLRINLVNNLFSNEEQNKLGSTTNTKNKVNYFKRVIPRHSEAYNFWNHYSQQNFAKDFMANQEASQKQKQSLKRAVNQLVDQSGKSIFFAKLTGPPRVTFLESVFPDSYFIHITRDVKAVINSYLKSFYWEKGGGFEKPWWNNILTSEDWKIFNEDQRPEVLAALQIKNILNQTYNELKQIDQTNQITLQYENFLANPEKELNSILGFLNLAENQHLNKKIAKKKIYKKQQNFFEGDDTINKIISTIKQ